MFEEHLSNVMLLHIHKEDQIQGGIRFTRNCYLFVSNTRKEVLGKFSLNTCVCIYNFVSYYIDCFIIESVDNISRDEPDSPLTQYITNEGISPTK